MPPPARRTRSPRRWRSRGRAGTGCVVSTLPSSTTNITGLRTISRGSSLATLSRSARRTIAGSSSDRAPAGRVRALATGEPRRGSICCDAHSAQPLHQRPQRQRREERQPDHDQHDADEQAGEQRGVGRERARRRRGRLLGRQRPGDGEHGHDQQEPPRQHGDARASSCTSRSPRRGRRRPSRCCWPADVNAYTTSDRPCGPGLRIERLRRAQQHRRRAEHEHRDRGGEDVQHDELHLRGLDLLPEELGCAADHQPGDEHREQREHEHPVEAGADPAGGDLAEHHVHEWHGSAARGEAVVRRDHRTRRRARGRRRVQARGRGAEAHLLALEVAAGLRRRRLLGHATLVEQRVAARSRTPSPRGRCRPTARTSPRTPPTPAGGSSPASRTCR